MSKLVSPDEIKNLAPMSTSAVRLCSLMNDPESRIVDIVKVVELDQALTSNVLRMANSALSGSIREIDNVKDGVVRLGTAQVLGLAIARQISGQMNQAFKGYELAEKELWSHSVAAALAAGNLSQYATESIPAVSFTSALLHDVGKLLLARHINQDRLNEIYRLVHEKKYAYLDAEREVLGTDHAEVGGMIARHWKFPDQITMAIEKHHDVDIEPNPVLDAVHIANVVAKLVGVGLGSEQMNMKVSNDAYQRLGIKGSGLEMLCAKVKIDLNEAEQLYSSR